MSDYELGIKPKRGVNADVSYVMENRDRLIYELVCDYMGEHAGMQDSLTLWTAFKQKTAVRLTKTGESVYIHAIQSFMDWSSHTVQTRYTICRSLDKEAFRTEYRSGLTICQPEDLEVIKHD